MRQSLIAAAGITTLALISFFQFPGHTWLQQDSQIYAPILEHLRDPEALKNDILVRRPHVSFTLYDESALALRKITGWEFQGCLQLEQLVTRALGIWGVWLIATALGLELMPALLVAAIFTLGATIAGPSVLTFEYEPVPRGLAVPLLLLAVGLAAHGRDLGAGIAGSVAFLIHPPTVYPFWGVYFLLTLCPSKPEVMRRRILALAPLFAAVVTLLFASRLQAGVGETQVFFSRLEPLQEQLQRMRAPYVWISIWGRPWYGHYAVLYALCVLGYLRLRKAAPLDLRFFLAGLPLVGLLSMPVSYWLLEKMKWALLPQFQPLRALLFVTVTAVILCAVAGVKAASAGRLWEAVPWLVVPYLIPVNTRVTQIPPRNRLELIAVLVCAAAFSVRALRWNKSAGNTLIVATALAAFFLIPGWGRVRNYPSLPSQPIEELAAWARASTPKDSVFLFPDAGRDIYPGIFRARALRAVYVDWKGGGQVNYLKELGEEWWARWQATMARPYQPGNLTRYRRLGIDYLVVRPRNREPGVTPAFENSAFIVYRVPK